MIIASNPAVYVEYFDIIDKTVFLETVVKTAAPNFFLKKNKTFFHNNIL